MLCRLLISFIHNTQLQITFGLFQKQIKPTLKGQGSATGQVYYEENSVRSEAISQGLINCFELAQQNWNKAQPCATPPSSPTMTLNQPLP